MVWEMVDAGLVIRSWFHTFARGCEAGCLDAVSRATGGWYLALPLGEENPTLELHLCYHTLN